MKTALVRSLLASASVALGAGCVIATATTGPATGLGDLVGMRGSAAETQMQARGYTAVGGHAEQSEMVAFWRASRDGGCVEVRTADGRYRSIEPVPSPECDRAEQATRVVGTAEPSGFRTVCGVFVDGKPVRYVCSVVGGDQHRKPTTLRFPDMVMVLHWLDGKRVRIELEGAKPIEGTWNESEGETDLFTAEKTWFYVSDPGMAAWELKSMDR